MAKKRKASPTSPAKTVAQAPKKSKTNQVSGSLQHALPQRPVTNKDSEERGGASSNLGRAQNQSNVKTQGPANATSQVGTSSALTVKIPPTLARKTKTSEKPSIGHPPVEAVASRTRSRHRNSQPAIKSSTAIVQDTPIAQDTSTGGLIPPANQSTAKASSGLSKVVTFAPLASVLGHNLGEAHRHSGVASTPSHSNSKQLSGPGVSAIPLSSLPPATATITGPPANTLLRGPISTAPSTLPLDFDDGLSRTEAINKHPLVSQRLVMSPGMIALFTDGDHEDSALDGKKNRGHKLRRNTAEDEYDGEEEYERGEGYEYDEGEGYEADGGEGYEAEGGEGYEAEGGEGYEAEGGEGYEAEGERDVDTEDGFAEDGDEGAVEGEESYAKVKGNGHLEEKGATPSKHIKEPASAPPPGLSASALRRKYEPRKVDHGPFIPSLETEADSDDSDDDEEGFNSDTFEIYFGCYKESTNNYKFAVTGWGDYEDDDINSTWLINTDENGPCDYRFKTTNSGEVRYFGTFPREGASGVVELFTTYRPGGGGNTWLPIPPGHIIPRQSIHQRAWAQRDFDAMAHAAGYQPDDFESSGGSKYEPDEDGESRNTEPSSLQPPQEKKARKRKTSASKETGQGSSKTSTPVRNAGRPSLLEIEQCEALGKEMWERVEELADRFGRDEQTILVAAGLYHKNVRLQNFWNCFQTVWRIKYPRVVAEDKDWKRKCSGDYHTFMDGTKDNPELKRQKEEEIMQELEGLAKDPNLVLNSVAQMNAVLSDSRKASQSKTERFLKDIHILKFVIYNGPNTHAAQKSGVVTGSPLILEMIQKGECRIQELINMMTGMIRGYQTQKEVNAFLDNPRSQDAAPAIAVPGNMYAQPATTQSTGRAGEKALVELAAAAETTTSAEVTESAQAQNAPTVPTGRRALAKLKTARHKHSTTVVIENEEDWIGLNNAALELYRERSKANSLGLTKDTKIALIRSIIANHLAEEYNLLRPHNAPARGNFPWANWLACAESSQLSIVNWPFSDWPQKADSLNKDEYRTLANAYIDDFDSGPKIVRWTQEQKDLDPTSFDYGNIPLVVNTSGEAVVKLYVKNKKYLTAYAAANPGAKDEALAIAYAYGDNQEDVASEKLYQISEDLEDPGAMQASDTIEGFTDHAETPHQLSAPMDYSEDSHADQDIIMSSPTTIIKPILHTAYPQARKDLFGNSGSRPPTHTNPLFVLPPPPPRPRGDIAPTRRHDGVVRMDALRRQPLRSAAPVNPDVFYRKSLKIGGTESQGMSFNTPDAPRGDHGLERANQPTVAPTRDPLQRTYAAATRSTIPPARQLQGNVQSNTQRPMAAKIATDVALHKTRVPLQMTTHHPHSAQNAPMPSGQPQRTHPTYRPANNVPSDYTSQLQVNSGNNNFYAPSDRRQPAALHHSRQPGYRSGGPSKGVFPN